MRHCSLPARRATSSLRSVTTAAVVPSLPTPALMPLPTDACHSMAPLFACMACTLPRESATTTSLPTVATCSGKFTSAGSFCVHATPVCTVAGLACSGDGGGALLPEQAASAATVQDASSQRPAEDFRERRDIMLSPSENGRKSWAISRQRPERWQEQRHWELLPGRKLRHQQQGWPAHRCWQPSLPPVLPCRTKDRWCSHPRPGR